MAKLRDRLAQAKHHLAAIWKANERQTLAMVSENNPLPVANKAKQGKLQRRRSGSLLSHSTLSDYRVKRVIHCYAHGMSPRETMETCRISHVTVYRLYRFIRERLLHVGIYHDRETINLGIEMQEELVGSFPWDKFNAHMKRKFGEHRAIRQENTDAYFAEGHYQFEKTCTPDQLNGLILLTIKLTGPLNQPPRQYNPAILAARRVRLQLMKLEAKFARSIFNVERSMILREYAERIKVKRSAAKK